MQSPILPKDFVEFIDKCKSLINEVWDYKYNREDFLTFDENFEKFKNRNLKKFPKYAGLIGSFKKHMIKKPKKVYYTTFYWHDLVCQKTLLELRKGLKKYQTVKHFLFQNKVLLANERLSLKEAQTLLSKLKNSINGDLRLK